MASNKSGRPAQTRSFVPFLPHPPGDETGDESEIAEQETEVKEPEAIPAAEEPEPKKAKTAKAKKSEPVVSSEEATPDSETKAAKKRTTKK